MAAASSKMNGDLGTDPSNPARLYVDGIFDMVHYGHMLLFQQVKNKFPHVFLIVGVSPDSDCESMKYRCVMNEFERSETIRHCKWVDEVVCPCPWVPGSSFLQEHRIDFVCHDDLPYKFGAGESSDVYGEIKKQGKFLATQRTAGISTTDVLRRILIDADYYSMKILNSEVDITDEDKTEVKEQGERMKEILTQVYSKYTSN